MLHNILYTTVRNTVQVRSRRLQQFSTGAAALKQVEERVLKVCRAYDKLNECQVVSLDIYTSTLLQGMNAAVRSYSHGPPLTIDLIQQRVLLVLKLYDKITPSKVAR